MLATLRRTLDRAVPASRRAHAWARQHPWLAAALLPALAVLDVLALVPLTPGISDLRRARSETPSVLVGEDGGVLAEYRRVNRE